MLVSNRWPPLSQLPYTSQKVYEPRPQSEVHERKRSAFTLIKWLLAKKNKRGIFPSHRRELLKMLLYKITEAEAPKHKTRFQSQGALACSEFSGKRFQECRRKAKLQHDHVYQRSKMIEDLEKAYPHSQRVDDILKKAVGCTVTDEEHKCLKKFDKQCDGWDRYRKAQIKVINMATGKPKNVSRRRKRHLKRKPIRKK